MRPMKDSGIAWIGKIPQEWEIKKYKYLAKLYTGNSIKDEEKQNYEDEYKAHPYVASKDIDGDTFAVSYDNGMYIKNDNEEFVKAYKNDILICVEGGSAGHKIAYLDRDVSFVNKLCCYHTYGCVSKFIYYSMISPSYKSEFDLNLTGLIGGVSVSKLNNFFVPLPPLPEQQAIADKLDRVCGEIDNVIAKTKAVVEEYKKLKQAIITEAVTGEKQCGMRNSQCGIKEKRPMKDSGIEWIGQIPQEWEVTKVKRYVVWKSQKGFPDAEVLSLYRDYGIIPKDSRDDNHNVTSLDTGSYKYVNVGDLVVNKMKAWQGSIAVSRLAGIVSPAYHVFEFYDDNSIVRFYLHYLLRSKSYLPEYLRLSTGMRIGQWDLSESDFRNIAIVVPPLPEQQAIVAYLDAKCGAIDELIAKKQQLIREMENYKKSVIYEYVTGKREVG